MSAHTPGPWQYMADSLEIVRACDVQPVIATVHVDNTSDAQAIADARLIAAAPTMFDFVTLIAGFTEPGRDPEDDAETLKSLIRSARTIRNQATGCT